MNFKNLKSTLSDPEGLACLVFFTVVGIQRIMAEPATIPQPTERLESKISSTVTAITRAYLLQKFSETAQPLPYLYENMPVNTKSVVIKGNKLTPRRVRHEDTVSVDCSILPQNWSQNYMSQFFESSDPYRSLTGLWRPINNLSDSNNLYFISHRPNSISIEVREKKGNKEYSLTLACNRS